MTDDRRGAGHPQGEAAQPEKPGWLERVVDVLEWLNLVPYALRLGWSVVRGFWGLLVAVYKAFAT